MIAHDKLTANFQAAEHGTYFGTYELPRYFAAVGELPTIRKTRNVQYYNVPCSFDIETTSFAVDGIGYGTMYLWGFCLNGAVCIGRTWEELNKLLSGIILEYHISNSLRLPIYVRNLGFEFQFIRKIFEWQDVFARQLRTPIRALTTTGLEFRDSYILTGQKLEKTAEELIELPVRKLTGNVDYSLPRHYLTPLTAAEIQYQINDVLVDCSLINDKIRQDGNVAKIPMTNTGYTRRMVRNKCLPHTGKSRWAYVRRMQEQTLTVDEYVIAKAAFAGGFVHASPQHCCTVQFDVNSEDLTSAYPAEMTLSAEFPASKGFAIDPKTITSRKQLVAYAEKFAFFGLFEFKAVESKHEYDYYLSESKVYDLSADAEVFNGRIASASHFKTALCHIDFLTMLNCYDFGGVRVLKLYLYRKGYLPKEYIMAVLDRYVNKTTLKGVAGREEDYMAAKRDTNSLYGMLVTMLDRPEVVYKNSEWQLDRSVDLTETIKKYNDNENRFISFLWGVCVTALVRNHIMHTINDELKDDYLYSDTDSVKFLNYEQHKQYFIDYNAQIDAKIQSVCAYYDIDPALYKPQTIKGEQKPLGYWDFDGHYTRFKALRAKSYLYTTGVQEELHITMAGVSKSKSVEYLLYKHAGNIDAIFADFDNNLVIPADTADEDGIQHGGTGKLTHLYNDEEFELELTDYTGRKAVVHEKSSINLSPCSFEIGFPEAFIKFLAESFNGISDIPEIMYN